MMSAEPSAEVRLSVTQRGVIRLPVWLRETYLSPDVEGGTCITQACGSRVFIWLWSDRENIRLEVPVDGFRVQRPYEQSIHRWGINLSRYLDDADHDSIRVRKPRDEKPMVEAAVDTFTAEAMPDV